jgi:hypothetical protein
MWHAELDTLLINQGLQGFTERAIVRWVGKRGTVDEVKGYLELLLKEDKVQKFKYKRDFYWRATVNLPPKRSV